MLATAKAAGPRHGDTSAAPRRKADSLVDELDTAVGLPRYLGVQTKLAIGSPDDPPVQQMCAACEAEDQAAVQQKCAASRPKTNRCSWDCSEYQEPTCVQTQDAGLPPVQAKCAACEEEKEAERAGLSVQVKCAACEHEDEEEKLQHKAAPGVGSPPVIHQAARTGLVGASNPLPHGDRIQEAFGRHDVSHVRANVGGPAHAAARHMGALAFTAGDLDLVPA